MTTMSGKMKILLLSSPGSECALSLQEVLAPHVELTTAHSLAESVQLLQAPLRSAPKGRAPGPLAGKEFSGFDVFLCEWCYGSGNWKEAVQVVRSRVPEVPVIVVCRTGGEAEWVEVLQSGASDLLSAPFSAEEVLAELRSAVGRHEEHALMKTA
jgi:DNA-binding response OmpR family regulator